MSDAAHSAELLMPGQTRWSIPLSSHTPQEIVLGALVRTLLAGEQSPEQIALRCTRMLGRSWRWVRPLAVRYVAAFANQTRPRRRDVHAFLLRDRSFQRAWSKSQHELTISEWLTESQQMQPVAAAASWQIPALASEKILADWLHLDWSDLRWFADLKGLGYKGVDSRLEHYHYRVLTKNFGCIRLIESPKERLKEMQRQILARILRGIPLHSAAHGFVKRRSILTYAVPHTGQHTILRMDLRDFFPSIPGARVQALFRTAGYPEAVADLLGGICTNAVPRRVWRDCGSALSMAQLSEARDLYARRHLPQGAPTSPALANVCAYRMDCRLDGLAQAAKARYSRYADDLAFSGGEVFSRNCERFLLRAAAIVQEEGFAVNHRKTRLMRRSQRQALAGLVLNSRLNVLREDFDQLKAILTNCARHGAVSQNRLGQADFRSHLGGRVSFVEMVNPAKGERLRAIFERIEW